MDEEPYIRALFSSGHLWTIAVDAAIRAQVSRINLPHAPTAETTVAIIMAAVAAEAFINELPQLILAHDKYGPHPRTVTDTTWRAIAASIEQLETDHVQVTGKYLIASVLLPGEPLQRDEQTFADFSKLITIRNNLVHLKVQVESNYPGAAKQKTFLNDFKNRRWTNPPLEDGGTAIGWLKQIQTPQVARWACRSSANIIWDTFQRLESLPEPVRKIYEGFEDQWRTCVNNPLIQE